MAKETKKMAFSYCVKSITCYFQQNFDTINSTTLKIQAIKHEFTHNLFRIWAKFNASENVFEII